MKRQYSIYTLLGSLILIPFLLAALLLLMIGYRSATLAMDREIHNSFDQNHSLLQTLLAGELENMRIQLKGLSRHAALREAASVSPEAVAGVMVDLEVQGDTEPFDLLLVVDSRNGRCLNFTPPLNLNAAQCDSLKSEPRWNGWHLSEFDNPARPSGVDVAFIANYPLIDEATGQVVAQLYGGLLLNQNFKLMSLAAGVVPAQTYAVGIGFGGQLIATSARSGSPELKALNGAVAEAGEMIRASHGLLAIGHAVDLDPEARLFFYSVADGMSFTSLKNSLVLQLALALLICILLAAGISMGAMQLALSPLNRLLEFAHKARQGKSEPLQSGRVQEFNELSEELAGMVAELHRSQERLSAYSREVEEAKVQTDRVNRSLAERSLQLEKSHQALSESMRENRELLHRLLRLQEQERKYLAQELHDDLGQALAVVSADAYLIKSQTQADSALYQSAESIYDRAQEMYDIVYNRIKQLRPMPLDDLGLLDALRFMPALENLSQHGVKVRVELPEQIAPLPENLQIGLYRIVQEALTNVIKHADASEVLVRLRVLNEPDRLELLVRDNGHGLPDDARRHGFGLAGIEERAGALGGQFEVHSGLGEGLAIKVSFPLAAMPVEL